MDLWAQAEALDFSEETKRKRILNLVHLDEEQSIIVELYYRQEYDGIPHWEMYPDDPNKYVEYVNGIRKLKHKVGKAKLTNRRIQQQQQSINGENEQKNRASNTATTNPPRGRRGVPKNLKL